MSHDSFLRFRDEPSMDGDVLATFSNPTPFDTYMYPEAPVEVAFGRDELTVERLLYLFAYIRREVIAPIEHAI